MARVNGYLIGSLRAACLVDGKWMRQRLLKRQ